MDLPLKRPRARATPPAAARPTILWSVRGGAPRRRMVATSTRYGEARAPGPRYSRGHAAGDVSHSAERLGCGEDPCGTVALAAREHSVSESCDNKKSENTAWSQHHHEATTFSVIVIFNSYSLSSKNNIDNQQLQQPNTFKSQTKIVHRPVTQPEHSANNFYPMIVTHCRSEIIDSIISKPRRQLTRTVNTSLGFAVFPILQPPVCFQQDIIVSNLHEQHKYSRRR